MFGLVGAIGGEPAHVRRLVTAGGTVFGLVGSVLGTVAGGLLGWGVVQLPAFRETFDRILDPYVVSPVLVAGAIGLGTIAATLAAALPAIAAARIPTTEALAERMPLPRSSTKLAQLGLVLIVAAGAAMAWATMQHEFELVALSLIVMLVGFLAAIPLVVSWLGRIAVRLPMEERIAARSTARHARRTGASLSAAALALSLPVAVGSLTLSMEAHDNANPGLAADQAVIGHVSTEEEVPMETAAVAASIPGSIVDILDFAVQRPEGTDENFWGYYGIWGRGADMTDDSGDVYPSGAQLIVGDATTLTVMHAETAIAALESGKAIGINVEPRDGIVQLETAVFNPTPAQASASQDQELEYIDVPAVSVELDYGRLDGAFTYWVISPQVAAELGFDTAPLGGALMRAPHDLSAADLSVIAAAAEATGKWSYGLATSQRSDGGLRMLITAVSMIIALVIVAITVALVAAESRREQALLVALGAEPASRRRIVGAGAAMLAALAAVVAIPAGLVPVSVALVSRQAGYPITVPWATVGLVLIAVPLLAGAVAALLSRPAKTARTMASIA
jgi:putative ABC transport system permease protein